MSCWRQGAGLLICGWWLDFDGGLRGGRLTQLTQYKEGFCLWAVWWKLFGFWRFLAVFGGFRGAVAGRGFAVSKSGRGGALVVRGLWVG